MVSTRRELGPIGSLEELKAIVEEIAVANTGCKLLFRGQSAAHSTVRSGLSRPDSRNVPEVEQGFSAVAGQILGHESTTIGNVQFRRAVLQHYGLKTHYVDLTSDPEIAAWFATHTYVSGKMIYAGTPFRRVERASYKQRTDGLGYLLVFVIPDAEALIATRQLFDISNLEPFMRPCRQQAWLISERPPLLPDPNDFWTTTIAIDCTKFASALTSRHLFPLPDEDIGYGALMNLPFVEVPQDWLHRNDEPPKEKRVEISFGMRALSLPEYIHSTDKDEYDHKWSDRTLTEPKPMQMWAAWQFELGEQFAGIQGNVADAVKLTLSPFAKVTLEKPVDDIPLRWPGLGNDDLLFTFSQYGHDKVIDIEYPYHGVWLHRDKELVIEHPMSADRDKMTVHAGHIYEFIGQDLQRYDLPSSCACGDPKSHEDRVRAMLRLSALVEIEVLILLPHPLGIPNWFFVI